MPAPISGGIVLAGDPLRACENAVVTAAEPGALDGYAPRRAGDAAKS